MTATDLDTAGDGGRAIATQSVSIPNTAPSATFTDTYNPTTGATAFAATPTDDGTITGYAWNFGDSGAGTGQTASHTYAGHASQNVTLTVTDNCQASTPVARPGDAGQHRAQIAAAAPTATVAGAAATAANPGAAVTFTAPAART